MNKGLTEDWLSLIIGLVIFVLSLGLLANMDLLGWVVTTSVWADLGTALAPVSKAYAGLGGVGSLIATYVGLLVIMTAGAAALGLDVGRFIVAFTVVFLISYICWIIGSNVHVALNTPAAMQKAGITWSLRLTPEGGFVVALVAGLIVGNFLPGLANWMKEAIRPELYVKIAIVILGGFLGIVSAEKLALATSLMFLGLASIIVAYLIFWSVVYYVARVWFGFSREWAAPLASGISDLRRVGGYRDRRRHPRTADRSGHGVVAGRDLRRGRAADSAGHCRPLPERPADSGGRLDGVVGQDRRRSGGERRHH